MQLKGVCQHHDLGPLGSAAHTRGYERQIEILKEFGVNSIRTSHNPPAPEVLDLCDKMGILVIDELFDVWQCSKEGVNNESLTNGMNGTWLTSATGTATTPVSLHGVREMKFRNRE